MDSTSPIAEATSRVLNDLCNPRVVNSAKNGDWKISAWQALEDARLTLAWVPEELGGGGASLADGFEVLHVAGRFAAPVALAETLLAGWLLSRVGVAAPTGAMSCGPTRDRDHLKLAANGTLNGILRAVPFAREARNLVVLAERTSGGHAIALIDAAAVSTRKGLSIAGDALDAVSFDAVRPMVVEDAPAGIDVRALLIMGAVARSAQMAGALEAVLEMSVAYANERVAFERPIAKFQAVQHNLARLAGEVAVAMAAAGSASDALANAITFDDGVFLEGASAKIRVGEAAGEGSGIAHQVFGAIGFTREHALHRFTRRLWAWRDDFGNESFWAVELGSRIAAKGADGLWPTLSAR